MRFLAPLARCAIAATLAAATLGCAGSEASEARPDDPATAPLKVVRGDFVERMLLTGELVAEDAVPLVTPNADIWPVQVRWLAEDGVEVKAGETVVAFDNSQLVANMEELRAGVEQARNSLAAARASAAAEAAEAGYALEQAEAEMEKARLRAEVPAELFSTREFEERQLARRKAELELAEAREKAITGRAAGDAQIELERLALTRAERRLEVAVSRIEVLSLEAPRDGVVLRNINPQEGRPFRAGDASFPGATVARMPDLESMMIEARLFDVDDGSVAAGQIVRATLDAYPDRAYQGRIRHVDQLAAEISSGSSRRTFRVLVDLDEVDVERMRPGMSVKLEAESAARSDVLLAPRAALEWTPAGARARRADGAWTEVVLGPCDAVRCVVEDGLEAGSELAPGAGA